MGSISGNIGNATLLNSDWLVAGDVRYVEKSSVSVGASMDLCTAPQPREQSEFYQR